MYSAQGGLRGDLWLRGDSEFILLEEIHAHRATFGGDRCVTRLLGAASGRCVWDGWSGDGTSGLLFLPELLFPPAPSQSDQRVLLNIHNVGFVSVHTTATGLEGVCPRRGGNGVNLFDTGSTGLSRTCSVQTIILLSERAFFIVSAVWGEGGRTLPYQLLH